MALHPKNAHLAASGGEDDLAYVWNTHTGEVVLKCDGFKDSVVFVAFSQDGTYLAAADMAGVIKVWKVATQELTWEFETSDITVKRYFYLYQQTGRKYGLLVSIVDLLARGSQCPFRYHGGLGTVDVEDSKW